MAALNAGSPRQIMLRAGLLRGIRGFYFRRESARKAIQRPVQTCILVRQLLKSGQHAVQRKTIIRSCEGPKLTRLPRNFFCASYDSFWPWFSTEICASNYNTGGFSFAALPTPTVKFQSQTETLPATRLLGFTIYNYGIRIQPGSIPITSPSSTGTSSSPISSTGTSSAPISSTSISPAAQSKPLSSAAKAGIGVGIAFPVLILGLGAGCYYSVRRRRMLKHGHKQPSPPDLPELPNSGILDQKVEMPDNTKDEKAPLSSPPIELQGPEVNAPVAYPREPLELSATASISRRPVPAPYVPDPPLVMNEEPRVDNSISHSPPQATRVTESGNNAQEGQSDIENELAQICEERERLKRLMELDKRRQELMEKLRH
jgi:hypothetical protein